MKIFQKHSKIVFYDQSQSYKMVNLLMLVYLFKAGAINTGN